MWPFRSKAASEDPRKRGLAQFAKWVGSYTGSPGSWGSQAQALRLTTEFQGWSYVAINFISNQFASQLPVGVRVLNAGEREKHAYKTKAFMSGRGPDPGFRRFVPRHVVEKAAGAKPHAEEYEYLPPDHPLNRILSDPNAPSIGFSVWYLASVYLELTGLAYLWKERDRSGQCVGLWNCPTAWVNPIGFGDTELIDFYEINPFYTNPGSYAGGERVRTEDMVCIRKASPFHPIAGYSPVQAQASEIDTYKQIQASRYVQLQNGLSDGAVIEMQPGYELDDEQMNRYELKLNAHYSGIFNRHRPMLVQGGKYIHAPTGRELEFIASSDQLRKHILAGYGLDESHLFSAESTYAAAIDARRKVRMDVLEPRLNLFAPTLSEQVARDEFGSDLRVLYPEPAIQTPEEKVKEWDLLNKVGAVTINETRAAFNLETRDEPEADQLMFDAMKMPAGSDGLNQSWNPEPTNADDTALEDMPAK